MPGWVKARFRHLSRWREYAELVARAACDLYPGAEVYVVGGLARGLTTVLSDIDILVVLPPRDRAVEPHRVAVEVLLRAMDFYGLPLDAPVELHVVARGSPEEALYGERILVKTCGSRRASP